MAFGKRLGLNRHRLKKQGKDKDGQKPLLNNMMAQHRGATNGEHILNTERTHRSGVHPDLISTESEVRAEVLSLLRKTLNTNSNAQDVEKAAVMVNRWGQLNGVTIDQGRYPQDWLCEFLQIIDESVHFPILPEDETQTSEFLKSIENMMFSEVCRLTPVLQDAGLLGYLIQSYSDQLFITLNLLLKRNLTVNVVLWLLCWAKRVFFSLHSQDVFRVLDPLLFSGWFEKAKKKLLTVLKKEIAGALQNILCNEEKHEDNELLMDEEWFIRVHLDVTQCLHGTIENAKTFSLTLTHKVHILCLEELHSFVQNYVHAERRRLDNLQPLKTNLVYLCRIVSNCIKLRCLAVQIHNLEKNKSDDDLNTICLLKKLEDLVLSIVQKMMKHKAQVSFKSYFKKGDEHIYYLMEEIQMQCKSLPQTEAAEEIKTIIVNLAYDCVYRVYLDCLMKSKSKNLERRWGNVEEIIKQDVLYFHNTFTQLNCSVEQNQFLHRMSEVLFCSDKATLELTCATLFKDFPEEREHYLPGLLRWKRTLSKQQVKEILDMGRLECPNSAHAKRSHPLISICCCLRC
ncbi:exocyst complex component 3-like isoform X2 [Triplophysa rosa]|uniref:exocyst complex component 3-like isoform X2 n=1 Tax=Triplophysa rosa TaxID=992332 RepID=UPI002545FAC1|nr:exocyst complex component 3-like isoform X2 [Triplophysa rosa]